MIRYKPYIHLARIKKSNTYRLSLLLLLPDGFDIPEVRINNLKKSSLSQVRLGLVPVAGQIHSGPRELLMYIESREGNRIEARVETTSSTVDLPDMVDPLAIFTPPDNGTGPQVLGKSIASTVDVETIDDPREGMEKDKQTDIED